MYRFDDFLADTETWKLSRNGAEIHLEPVVLKLLIYLIEHRERLVTRHELMDTVWGDTVISESALTKAVARLRKALDDDSAAPRYLETVRSQGYRFIATVEVSESPGRSSDTPAKNHPAIVRQALLAGAATIVVLILAALIWAPASRNEAQPEDVIRSLAVLPLKNLTGDSEQDYYVDGLQELLTTELSQLPGLRITSRQSTVRYRNSHLPTADIAAELGVDALVEGSLLRDGDKIELTIQLIDGRNDEHIWAERYARKTPYIFDLIADTADAIGTEIAAKAHRSVEKPSHGRLGPVDPRAIDAYALGIMHLDTFTRAGIQTAIEQFGAAVAIEPEFALAWGQLGAAYAMQGMLGYALPQGSKDRLHAAELKAVEADDSVAIGHAGLGWARWWAWDFDTACDSFEKALRLNPSAPYAIHGDADCLMLRGLMDDSITRLRELQTISPFSAMHNWPLASHLYVARRYDEAITVAEAMQARTPRFSMHWFLARVYWQQGLFDKALEEERLEFERRGDAVLLAALEEGFEAGGPAGAMRAIAKEIDARARQSYLDPFDIGEAFARAGMVNEALDWLEEAVEHGSYEMTYLAFWPHLDVVRDDPRYQDMLERVYGARAREIAELSRHL